MSLKEGRRPHVITVKLSAEEKRRFDRVAKHLGLDVSSMIRSLVAEKDREK